MSRSIMIQPSGVIAIRSTAERNGRKHYRKRVPARRFWFQPAQGIVPITLDIRFSKSSRGIKITPHFFKEKSEGLTT